MPVKVTGMAALYRSLICAMVGDGYGERTGMSAERDWQAELLHGKCFYSGAIVTGIPAFGAQLALIPVIVNGIERAGMCGFVSTKID